MGEGVGRQGKRGELGEAAPWQKLIDQKREEGDKREAGFRPVARSQEWTPPSLELSPSHS